MVTTGTKRVGENGGSGHRALMVDGKKLVEAASYLKSARMALLNWTKEAYVNADRVDRHIQDIQEVLDWANRLDVMQGRLEAKGSVFG